MFRIDRKRVCRINYNRNRRTNLWSVFVTTTENVKIVYTAKWLRYLAFYKSHKILSVRLLSGLTHLLQSNVCLNDELTLLFFESVLK